MQSSSEKSKFGSDRSPMSEKHDQSPRRSGNSNERETERRGWQTTFDVYVGRIPSDWTKEKLMEIFQPFGEIKSVDLRNSPENLNRLQFAFVRYPQEEMAKCAVDALAHNPVENVSLQINIAQRNRYKQERQGRSDFGQPRGKMYSEHKRVNDSDCRRPRTRPFGSGETSDYGGGYGNSSHPQKKEWSSDRQRSREEQEKVILVTEVDSPVRFWGQIAKPTVAHNLSTASDELQFYCPTGLKVADINSLQKNKIYGGMYPVDNLWYRCSVIKFLSQGMVTVRYIDFGNTETIKKETLVELPPSLADVRPFAQLYHLADCAVSSDPEANEMTYALGIEQLKNLIIGQLVSVKFISENTHGGVNVLVSYPGKAGKSINEIMRDRGCVQDMYKVLAECDVTMDAPMNFCDAIRICQLPKVFGVVGDLRNDLC
ncbi:uncharacterized protein LOC114544022 [Dendronephthya gigantea]|uniref:uncharacterized protein LOC114544022 n=1 Tax=Dendronephthya gigantea TaxID=151771 RepID=UPI00106B55CC|nr:uncharacterized protein LOC114544022 [Dendronephthya gigantea]